MSTHKDLDASCFEHLTPHRQSAKARRPLCKHYGISPHDWIASGRAGAIHMRAQRTAEAQRAQEAKVAAEAQQNTAADKQAQGQQDN